MGRDLGEDLRGVGEGEIWLKSIIWNSLRTNKNVKKKKEKEKSKHQRVTSHLKLSKNKKKMNGGGCAFIAIKSEIRTFSKRHKWVQSSGEKPIPYPVSSHCCCPDCTLYWSFTGRLQKIMVCKTGWVSLLKTWSPPTSKSAEMPRVSSTPDLKAHFTVTTQVHRKRCSHYP